MSIQNKRIIKGVYKATYEPIKNLITYRALPTAEAPMDEFDPFLFLNHHGHQVYLPRNGGLPFGPHPHRGFETVTFILEGELLHKDNSGGASIIKEGGVQWMTAGSGLVHAEISSNEFMSKGGPLEILQLWVNLPARFKMTPPKYIGLQKNDIPTYTEDEGNVIINLVSGSYKGERGAVQALTDITLMSIDFKPDSKLTLSVPTHQTIFFYVVKGELVVNEENVFGHQLVAFTNEGEKLEIESKEDSIILFGHATPFGEPIVAYGPFVMNTQEEIQQAYTDYRTGKFGSFDV